MIKMANFGKIGVESRIGVRVCVESKVVREVEESRDKVVILFVLPVGIPIDGVILAESPLGQG